MTSGQQLCKELSHQATVCQELRQRADNAAGYARRMLDEGNVHDFEYYSGLQTAYVAALNLLNKDEREQLRRLPS
jgi:hypothetical protein